jgi:hypothetical protein
MHVILDDHLHAEHHVPKEGAEREYEPDRMRGMTENLNDLLMTASRHAQSEPNEKEGERNACHRGYPLLPPALGSSPGRA